MSAPESFTYLNSHDNDEAILGDLVVSDSLGFVLHNFAISDQLLCAGRDSMYLFNFDFQIAYLHKRENDDETSSINVCPQLNPMLCA